MEINVIKEIGCIYINFTFYNHNLFILDFKREDVDEGQMDHKHPINDRK